MLLFCCSYNFTRVATCFRRLCEQPYEPFPEDLKMDSDCSDRLRYYFLTSEIPRSAVDFEADPLDIIHLDIPHEVVDFIVREESRMK